MKKLIIILILLNFVLVSCKQEKKQPKMDPENVELTESKYENFQINEIDSSQFPKALKYEGFIKKAFRWKDKSGDNIAIITETGSYRSQKIQQEFEQGKDAKLFGYHFLIKDNQAIQTWKVYDYINDCPDDITVSFIKNTFKITDLNRNGVAEIWLMYKMACQSDVSPSDMKIIMHEGKQKFAMRGVNRVQIGIDDNGKNIFMGGEYKFDKAFDKVPKVLKDYAVDLWNKDSFKNAPN